MDLAVKLDKKGCQQRNLVHGNPGAVAVVAATTTTSMTFAISNKGIKQSVTS